MRLMSEGTLPGPWIHARIRISSCDSDDGGNSRSELRNGLYMAITAGVVRKVVNSAIKTRMANISSFRTCLMTNVS